MRTRRQRFSDSTKRALVDVAERLFTEHGYSATSLDAIVACAEESLPLADELSRQRPRDADILMARARARLEAGDPAGALTAVREALAAAPARPDVYQLQAIIASRLGDLHVERCRARLPHHAHAAFAERLDQHVAAVDHFSRRVHFAFAA